MTKASIEKIVEDFNPDSPLTHQQQLEVYTVRFLGGDGRGFRLGDETTMIARRADGNIAHLEITHGKDHRLEFVINENGHTYKTRTVVDDKNWERYLRSAFYRMEVDSKIAEVDRLTAMGVVTEDLMPCEKAIETLTGLLQPKLMVTHNNLSINVNIRQYLLRSVYEDALRDIDAAYGRLAERFAYFEGKLGECLTLSLRKRVEEYGQAYAKAERRCKVLK